MTPDVKFHQFLMAWAEQQGCNFEIDNFDGRESPDLIDGMEVDDVWGWLTPEGQPRKDEDYGCVEWTIEQGNLRLTWVRY